MSSELRGRSRDGDEARGGGILWALGLSVLLHCLIFLLGPWIPLSLSSVTVHPDEDEAAVTFRFEAPVPAVEPQALAPAPAPPEPKSEPEPPTPQPEPEPLLRPEPVPGVGPLTESPGTPPESEQSGPDAPEDGPEDAAVASAPSAGERSRPDDLRSADRRLDVGRALREFEDARRERPSTFDPEPRREPSPGNRFRGDFPSLPSSTFGMGNLVFESGDYDWTNYARQVLVILERAVNRRVYVTLDDFERWAHENDNYVIRPDQRVGVRFVIERSGEIVGIQIEGRSGVTPFDAAVQDSLEEAILPPLPSDFPRDREVVHIEGLFPAGAPILQLRTAYTRWKAMGLF